MVRHGRSHHPRLTRPRSRSGLTPHVTASPHRKTPWWAAAKSDRAHSDVSIPRVNRRGVTVPRRTVHLPHEVVAATGDMPAYCDKFSGVCEVVAATGDMPAYCDKFGGAVRVPGGSSCSQVRA